VNPATAKEYFFWAKVHSDWREGSPITFTGEFNGNAYHARSDGFWSGVLSTIKGIVEART
jgi:hypothetical protein